MTFRRYQTDHKSAIYSAWDGGAQNVMGVMPTGGGKTTVFCGVVKELDEPACIGAHRQELVSQASLALNREEVPHAIIAPKEVIQQTIRVHMDEHGKSFYNSRSAIRVAGVHTLVARANDRDLARWFGQVRNVVFDEGHHVLAHNLWGRAFNLFTGPQVRGLFPTAHALRADGAGLGRDSDGLVDALVLGPYARQLVNTGYLCDYRLIAPPTDIDISEVPIGSTGDFSAPQLRAAVHKSGTIVGDIVQHYLKFAAGKLGLTFVVDVEAADETCRAYIAAGVPAAVITANTPIHVRAELMRRFRRRELLQLVSVDVLGEGTDVPAVEVISLARHTASFQLYSQQFGRGLRLMISRELMGLWDSFTDEQRLAHIAASVKPTAIIIDHVGNWERHGLPDKLREYTLEKRERGPRKGPSDAIPLRRCLNLECMEPYERILIACPHCGTVPPVRPRGAPEQVDGDCYEIDPEILRKLRGEADRIDHAPIIPLGATPIVAAAIRRRWNDRQAAQVQLRATMDLWGGWQRHLGRADRESWRRFFFTYGVDVMTARTLNEADATTLWAKIQAELISNNVEAA